MTVNRRWALKLALTVPLLPLIVRTAFAEEHSVVHEVIIENMSFSPANLSIKAGDTVLFTNAERLRHSAVDLDSAWDTGLLSMGQSASISFDGEGTYQYRCGPHANMRGTITVN